MLAVSGGDRFPRNGNFWREVDPTSETPIVSYCGRFCSAHQITKCMRVILLYGTAMLNMKHIN